MTSFVCSKFLGDILRRTRYSIIVLDHRTINSLSPLYHGRSANRMVIPFRNDCHVNRRLVYLN